MKKKRKQLPVRVKLFVFLCVVSLLPLLLCYQVLIGLGSSSFRTLRDAQIRDGLEHTARSFDAVEHRLMEAANGVAGWEELTNFFTNPDSTWAKENLADWAPQSYNLDYLALNDTKGNALYSWLKNEHLKSDFPIPLFEPGYTASSGWISTPRNLWLLAKADITRNGSPLGSLVFGRRLTHRFLLELQAGQEADLMVYYGSRLLATTDTTSTLPLIDPSDIFSDLVTRQGTYFFEAKNQNRIIGFQGLRDINGTEIATVGWTNFKSPAHVIQDSIREVLLYFGLPLLTLVLLTALVLGLWIERPIRGLSKTMEEVSRTGDLTRRVPVTGGGEIASMSRSFNQMLMQLSIQRDELLTFRTMILAMKEGVLIENTSHEVVYMNPRMEELLGISFDEISSGDEPVQLDSMIATKGQRLEDKRGFITEEVEWVRCDGRRIQALKTSGYLEDQPGTVTGILSTFVDITERNDLEIELIEASRMAFLGLYSQGIIHNINGPLNSIMGFSSLLCKEQPESELPQRINMDARRMAEQVSNLGHRWHRTGIHREEALNLNEIIQDEIKFLEADLFYKHNVEKHFDFDPNLPPIQGVYGDFSHAILNIIINSIDALSESPIHKLFLRTRYSQEEIRIEIEDTGVGIPPENLNKIFLPFFSTKRRDRKEGIPSGAGLGLAIARKVLEPYDVKFEVTSEPGKGTCMTLHIPYIKNSKSEVSETYSAEVLV